MTLATGLGSHPGTDIRDATSLVRDVLATAGGSGTTGLPYLPELPARGPWADMTGRAAALLVDLPVDLHPDGWRLAPRPGAELRRAQSLLAEDLDALALAYAGYTGPVKVQVTGPWTLAASLWLARGERVLADPSAVADLSASLAEGVAAHLLGLRRMIPGATLVIQLDEPGLTAVLDGSIPTTSGMARHARISAEQAGIHLETVLASARAALGEPAPEGAAGAPVPSRTVIHSCAGTVPWAVLATSSADALALDVRGWSERDWEPAAGWLETPGKTLWAGGADRDLVEAWRRIGLPKRQLDTLAVTPPCGLAGASAGEVSGILRERIDLAQRLTEAALG